MFNFRVFVFVVVGIFSVYGYSSFDLHCPKKSIFRKCADPCPKICGLTHSVDLCNKMSCSPGCECLEGYVLSMKGKCISHEDCLNENCGKNAVHSDKPCTTTCHDAFHGLPCETELIPGCECLPGYFMNARGDCVDISVCQEKDMECGENESFSFCASSCPITCSNMYLDVACNFMCNMRCDCNPGYIYNAEGKCVQPEQCIPSEVECPIPAQNYTTCGHLKTCRNMFEPLKRDANCKRGCFCSGKTVYDTASKKCVQHHECKESRKNTGCKEIDRNMIYYASHPKCDPTCDDRNPECGPEAVNGCFCRKGYVLNAARKCIPEEKCCGCDV